MKGKAVESIIPKELSGPRSLGLGYGTARGLGFVRCSPELRALPKEGWIAQRSPAQEVLPLAHGSWSGVVAKLGAKCEGLFCVLCHPGPKSVKPVKLSFLQFTEGAGSLPWPSGSATKPGKPKGKKKISSVRQKFDVSVCSQMVLCY